MKKKLLFIILLFVLTPKAEYLSKKEFINTLDLESVIISKNRILVAAEEFFIYTSDDWGDTWTSFKVKKTYGGDALHLFKAKNGSLVVSGGLYDDHFIAISKDNGISWERVWKDEDMEIGCFVEIANGNILGFGDEDEFLISSSNLNEWYEYERPWKGSHPLFYEEDVRAAINLKDDRFLIVGDDGLMMCFNSNMSNCFYGNKQENEQLSFNSLVKNSEDLIYAGTDKGDIFKSNDEGKTWDNVYFCRNRSLSIRKIAFSPKGTGIAVGEDGVILISDNNGKTWKQITSHTDELLNDVTYLCNEKFVIVGDEGTFLIYDNELVEK